MNGFKYCPLCTGKLEQRLFENNLKLSCVRIGCGFVNWENPTPVVLVIVQLNGKYVVTHNVEWPEWKYSLISGFIDTKESPERAAIREVKEELALDAVEAELIAVSLYEKLNQLMISYFVKAVGEIMLNEEHDSYKLLTSEEMETWEFGQGSLPAIKKWVSSKNA